MLLSSHLCEIGSFGIFQSETEREMRSPLLQKMRQEFNYGNIDFLHGYVQRFYNKRKQEFLFGYYYGNFLKFNLILYWVPLQEYEYEKGGDGNAPNVDNFGITETKSNYFYLSSCFWSPHKVNSACSLCLVFTFKNNYSLLIQWLLNSLTPRC